MKNFGWNGYFALKDHGEFQEILGGSPNRQTHVAGSGMWAYENYRGRIVMCKNKHLFLRASSVVAPVCVACYHGSNRTWVGRDVLFEEREAFKAAFLLGGPGAVIDLMAAGELKYAVAEP